MKWLYILNTRAQSAAENIDDRGILLNHVVYPQITTFLLRAVPILQQFSLDVALVDWLLKQCSAGCNWYHFGARRCFACFRDCDADGNYCNQRKGSFGFFSGFVLMAFAKLNMIVSSKYFWQQWLPTLFYLSTGRSNGDSKFVPRK